MTESLNRARAGWAALQPLMRSRPRRYVVHEPRRFASVPLWPFSQVLHTAAVLAPHDDRADNDLPRLIATLETFRREDSYSERPSNRRRYYDDNAWIALAALDFPDRARGTELAERLIAYLRTGATTFDDAQSGIGWVEGGDTHNACSTGSTGLASVRLASRLPGSQGAALLELGSGCLNFLVGTLNNDDGLIRDHRRADSSIDAAIYTYNQGLTIGLLAELGDVDGAVELAHRTATMFTSDRLWAHPPAFNAILMRELLHLPSGYLDSTLLNFIDGYLERVWSEARDRSTGLFTSGGIGRYDDGVVLDHAALTGTYVARAHHVVDAGNG